MANHRALICGGGRIGAGYNWMPTSYVYTHADAYLALKDRVELVGFVEPDGDRAFAAQKKYSVPVWEHLEDALDVAKPDVVSICTQPDQRCNIWHACVEGGVKGIWNEKPLNWGAYTDARKTIIPCQVNYWRRFEPMHRRIKDKLDAGELGDIVRLVVCAKRDVHTVCHFTDLALWWGVPQAKFVYVEIPAADFTVAEYTLYTTKRVLRFEAGGAMMTEDEGAASKIYPGMRLPLQKDARAWSPIFMLEAVNNLMDAMESLCTLKSPPEGAIEAEAWADQILKENA